MKIKQCKRLLSLIVAVAMFLSMGTGVFAEDVSASDMSVTKVVSQSDVVEKSSEKEMTSAHTVTEEKSSEKTQFDLSSVQSTRDMPYAVTGSKVSMVQSNTAKRSTVTTKKYNSSRSIIEAETSGKCGDNINWSFDTATGKLTLSGTGSMYDYDVDNSKDPGWRSYAELIQNVVIGNGITTIGDEAFLFCSSLETASIPDTVTIIGEAAFANCVNLKTATLPSKLVTIKKSAFDNCRSLSNVVFPDTLETIGGWAFEGCYPITSIHLPKKVNSIGAYAFAKCGVEKITVDSGNAVFTAVDNVLFSKDKTKLIYYPFVKTASSYSVPNTVKEISDGAFGNASSLKTVTIPSSVTRIGVWAFAHCDQLQTVRIPNSVTEIGYRAFFKCINLADSNIPTSLSQITLGMFEDCTHMTSFTIPETVKSIDKYAFINTGIKEINIPGRVESIAEQAFYACKLLQKVTLHTGLKSIGDDCFGEISADRIYVPSSVTSIGSYAFPWNCTLYGESGSYVEKYANDTMLSDYKFIVGNCPDVPVEDDTQSKSGTFPSSQTWSYDANAKVFTVTGTGKVEMYDYDYEYDEETEETVYTGDYDKYQELSMISVYVKKLVIGEGIEDAACLLSGFFTNVEVISLPSTLLPEEKAPEESDDEDEIESRVYYYGFTGSYCGNLREINVTAGNSYLKSEDGVLFNFDKTVLIAYPSSKGNSKYVIPDTVQEIGDWAFYNCGTLHDIILPSGLKIIGDCSFYNCWFLSSVIIPDGVTEIGDAAFMRCINMDNVVIGKGVTELKGTFARCKGLTCVSLPDNLKMINVGFFHTFEGGYDVGTFEGCTSLKRLYIPKSVDHISVDYGWEDSFSENYGNCTSFEGFIVDKDNPVYYSKDGVLFNKQTKTLLFYPIAKKDSSYTIPNDVLAIDSAFSWWDRDNPLFNENLKSLIIPKTVTTLGNYVFVGLSNLEDIYYEGTQQQWINLVSSNYDDENDLLPNDNVTIHYNYVPTPLSIISHPANVTAKVNDSVSFSVKAQGDGLTYQWYYKKTGQTSFSKWSGKTSASITVTAESTWDGMQVYCQVTDASGKSVQSESATITIMPEATFTASLSSPQQANTTILLKATGGSKYKFYYECSGSWKRLQDVSSTAQYSWKPTSAGTYTLYVDIMDNSGRVLECRKMTYVITKAASELTATMTAQYAAPQTAGTTIKLTVNATGGTGSYQYKFYSECNGVWTKLWDYDTKNTYNWHATTVGTHTVYCDVKDSSGKVVCSSFKYQIVKGTDFVADLNANRISGQYTGTEIRLLAGSSNGSGTVQYKFYVEKDGTWTRLRDYGTQDYFLWTPAKAGFYNVYVDAKDSSGKVASKRLCITIESGTALKIKSLTANPASPTKGNPVILTGTTTGGESPVTYKFYYELNGSWVKIQDFGSSNTCTFTPSKAGTYHIYMDAIDGKKNTQCLMITVTVK